MSQILIVESEKSTLAILGNLLKTEGYKVVSTGDPAKAAGMIKTDEFKLMICGANGAGELDLIRKAVAEKRAMPVIAIVKGDAADMSAKAGALNPFACIEKPLKIDKLLATVQKAVDYSDTALTENVNLNLKLETCYQFEDVVAESPAMKSVCEMASRVAATDITMLIWGEKGTGKETIAKAVHARSKRKEKEFVAVNCGLVNAGVLLFGAPSGQAALRKAAGGTLFLGEIGSLKGPAQDKLLKALKERKARCEDDGKTVDLDVRLIVSTSKNLEDMTKNGTFNADLYKLLRIIVVKVPPLRERRQDIMPTIRQVLRKKTGSDKAAPTFDQEVVKLLESYPWPENVDTIIKVFDGALKKAQEGKITKQCLPAEIVRVK